MKLVYLLQWASDPIAKIATNHPDVKFVRAADQSHAAREVVDADVLLVGGPLYVGEVAAAVNDSAPNLRWIQSSSIGTDKFLEGGVPPHVIFTNSAGLKGSSVAEHGIALLLGHLRALPKIVKLQSNHTWGRDTLRGAVSSLEGRTALLVGYGSIGSELARKAKAFDMHVIALNRSGSGGPPADEVRHIGELDHVLPRADVVMVSLPLSKETVHLLGPKQFAAMKQSAVLLNVGRGPVVDQQAMKQALLHEQIAAACLDVFDEEPLPADDELWSMPNVIISPHVAGTGGPIYERFAQLVDQNLQRLQNGARLINLVDIENSGYVPRLAKRL
ncbi:MAG: D-2-hydroxyacid dehydrogenase [Hyphomicrobiaceae bacterium]